MRRSAFLLIVAAYGLSPARAFGYCRNTTCDSGSASEACEPDELGCSTLGAPLFWPEACVTYAVQQLGSPLRGISAAEADAVMQNAFRSWLNANCPDGTTPSIGVVPLGGARCDQVEFNASEGGRGGGPNANLLIFRDDLWPYSDQGSTLARTTLTFDTTSGAILDADIEVNSAELVLTTGAEAVASDLQSILTHEVGHFFGLDHSVAAGATMQLAYSTQDLSARTLSSDDQTGICSVYAPAGDSPVECPSGTAPIGGFSRDCGPALRSDASCLSMAGPSGRPDDLPGHALGWLLVSLLIGRRLAWRR